MWAERRSGLRAPASLTAVDHAAVAATEPAQASQHTERYAVTCAKGTMGRGAGRHQALPHMTEMPIRPGKAVMPLEVGKGGLDGLCMTLNQPAFGKREHLVAGHDKMVDDPHVHQAQRRLQGLRQRFIGTRWLGFS